MSDVTKMTVSGKDAVSTVQTLLDKYENDEAVEEITIEIHSHIAEAVSSDDNSASQEARTADETADGEPGTEEKQRYKREIRRNTSHHRVLTTLAEMEPASGKSVKGAVEGVSESSIYPALTTLYERKLADRTRIEDVDNPYYEYELTEWGQDQLEELGQPEEGE